MTFRRRSQKIRATVAIAAITASTLTLSAQKNPAIGLAPSTMAKLGTVDPRFVSYNVEMVEVTGGRFWKPYKSAAGRRGRAEAANFL